jgi:hypothetical protein
LKLATSAVLLMLLGGMFSGVAPADSETQAQAGGWKKCGETFLFRGLPKVAFGVKRTSCFQGILVFAHVLVDHSGACNPQCQVIGYRCAILDSGGLLCSKGAKQVRAIPLRRN